MQNPSYKRHAGHISSNWEEIGDYGSFLNASRLDAWTYIIEKQNLKPNRIIDFGCAGGSWSENWLQLGFKERIGIDINAEAIERAKLRLEEAHYGDADYLENFREESLIGCNGVVVHILEEREVQKVFHAAHKALASDGYFICAVLNPDYYLSPKGFVPWKGPLSCTRPIDFHLRCAERAGFKIATTVGAFINPWFSHATEFIASDDELKADQDLYRAFVDLARIMRRHESIRPFSEILLACLKP